MRAEFLTILKRSWISHFWMNFATTCVLSLSLGIIFGVILFSNNVSRFFTVWGDEIQITTYLQDFISDAQRLEIESKLKGLESVANIEYTDKKTAAEQFERSLKSYGPHFLNSLKSDVGNPFPASFRIQLRREYKQPEKIEEVAKKLQSIPGVEDVSYGQEWVKNYSLLVKFVKGLSLVFGIVIFVSCLFTVSNSIQASLNSRREEIEILELIGATSAHIRKPFLIEGAFQGFFAAVLSLLIIGGIYRYSVAYLENILGSSSVLSVIGFYSVGSIFFMVVLGGVIGALGSYICVSKINTGWAAATVHGRV